MDNGIREEPRGHAKRSKQIIHGIRSIAPKKRNFLSIGTENRIQSSFLPLCLLSPLFVPVLNETCRFTCLFSQPKPCHCELESQISLPAVSVPRSRPWRQCEHIALYPHRARHCPWRGMRGWGCERSVPWLWCSGREQSLHEATLHQEGISILIDVQGVICRKKI